MSGAASGPVSSGGVSDPSVAQAVFTFFGCVSVAGDRYISLYPAVSCDHNSEYRRVFPLFVVLAIAVCAMPLLVAGRLYQLNRSGLLFGDSDTKYVYGIW